MAQNLGDHQQARALLSEVLRAELGRLIILQAEAALRSDAETDARIVELEEENTALRRMARRGDFGAVTPWIAEAADRTGAAAPDEIDPELGRAAVKLKRGLNDAKIAVLDGEPVEDAAGPLVRPYSSAGVGEFTANPMTLSAAIEETRRRYPSKEMRGNTKICADLLLSRFGEVPVAGIDEAMLLDLFAWAYRLPKAHGKKTNSKAGRLTKDEEIAEADAKDALAIAEVRALPGLSDPERRALLAERLVPRLTRQTIKRYRDSVRRVWKSAQALGAKGLADVPGYAAVEAHLAASEPDDPLYMHVSKPKTREPWSEERLVRLFESPIYRGCASADRRWLPGRLVIRDALYWVPLLLATIGTRITELLELTPRDIMQKNGVLCLAIGRTAEKHVKTTGSIRYVPIPQLLLDLGFAEWVATCDAAGATMLFPEIARRAGTRSLADTFLKVRQQVWKHLDLTDHDEDCYALRKTLQTMLEANGVSEGRRQALAGHLNGKIVNRHYTAFHLRALKAEVDRAGHRIAVRDCLERGFPVIERCAIADELPATTLDITLGATGIASVTLAHEDSKVTVGLDDVSPQEAAHALPRQVAEILAVEQVRRPSRGPRAEMADRLCAFAAVRVGAVHAVSRTKAIAAALIGRPVDGRELAEH